MCDQTGFTLIIDDESKATRPQLSKAIHKNSGANGSELNLRPDIVAAFSKLIYWQICYPEGILEENLNKISTFLGG